MKIIHVVGARPNFMKIAPVWAAIADETDYEQRLVHTGQHYDVNMSDVFFTDLGLPQPDHYLDVKSGSHAVQTAAVMVAFEQVVLNEQPDMVMVYGDVNSTVAAAIVCAKLHVPFAHVEAGLRSGDRRMPEEINRLLTDSIANLLLTPSEDGDENLLREGVSAEKIFCIGNVMIDTLVRLTPASSRSDVLEKYGLEAQKYAVLTLHRPSNVDEPDVLRRLIEAFSRISRELPVIFPVHPRTRQRIADLGIALDETGITAIGPQGYLDFMRLVSQSALVMTDSGGIQEETSYLGIYCLTLRENTERPITIDLGTSELVGSDIEKLEAGFRRIMTLLENGLGRADVTIPKWDGQAGKRIVQVLKNYFQ